MTNPDALPDLTGQLAADAASIDAAQVSRDAVEVAKQCILDWLGVALAARYDPLVEILAADAEEEEGGRPIATILGRKSRVGLRQAALINGAMGHALDYDDVSTTMGHPTAPVAPVALGLAEHLGGSGADLISGFIAGVEAEVAISLFAGPSHYARGFHGTATFGTFGAATAAGRLLRLDHASFRNALGLAGTQAAGLKAVFGTMAKPFHAGKAAMNGLMAAQLARRGFTANPEVLTAPRGFGTTQSDMVDAAAALRKPPGGFHIRNTLFKSHAACYLTHSTITACLELSAMYRLAPENIARITIGVDPGHLAACAIPDPQTGLESKFSLAHAAALALSAEPTGDERTFRDDVARRPDLVALRQRAVVAPRTHASFTLADVTIDTADGATWRAEADVAIPATDLDQQWALISAKFRGLASAYLGAQSTEDVIRLCRSLEQQPSVGPLIMLVS